MTYSVDELLRATDALRSGQFRLGAGAGHPRHARIRSTWEPTGVVVAVVGATPRVGTTTVALAIAEACGSNARLVETATRQRTGMSNAVWTELGFGDRGWRRGGRKQLVIERAADDWASEACVPLPEESSRSVTIVDVGWDINAVLSSASWLGDLVIRQPIVIVTSASIPGLSAAEHALQQSGRTRSAHVVAVGPVNRRMPRALRGAIGPALAAVAADDRLHLVKASRQFAMTGMSALDLPFAVSHVGRHLADQFDDRTTGDQHDHA